MKNTTDVPVSPTDSVERTARQSSDLSRLSNPRIPLSVPESKQYARVRAAAWLLRYCDKKPSVRKIALHLSTADKPMRTELVASYLKRFNELETLQTLGRKHSGNKWETESTYDGNTFEHAGKHFANTTETNGKQTGSKRRVSSLDVNINIKGTDKKTTENDEADDFTDEQRKTNIAKLAAMAKQIGRT